jgi:hypothetical protein
VLEMAKSSGIKGRRGILELRVLDGGPVGSENPGVGRMLGPRGCNVEKFDEGAFDVSWHGNVDGACLIVPM